MEFIKADKTKNALVPVTTQVLNQTKLFLQYPYFGNFINLVGIFSTYFLINFFILLLHQEHVT